MTIPAGKLVLPGQTVASAADLTDPTKVVTTTGTTVARQIVSELNQLRSTNLTLAAGYVSALPGPVGDGGQPRGRRGRSPQSSTATWPQSKGPDSNRVRPTAATPFLPPGCGPTFLSHRHDQVQGLLYGFRARATGRDAFKTRAGQVAHSLGRSNSIRADQGQPPIAAAGDQHRLDRPDRFRSHDQCSPERDGDGRTPFTIGQNFQADTGAVIMGGPGRSIGDNVSIGAARSWTGVPSAAARPWELERMCSTRRSRREATFLRERFGLTVFGVER